MNKEQDRVDWNLYYNSVRTDFHGLKAHYPFCSLIILPTAKPTLAEIRVVAVCKKLTDAVFGVESDFLGEYSRELHLYVPTNYKETGCTVYGAGWVKTDKLANEDIHFFHEGGMLIRTQYGLKMCVGTPESFSMMKNVILENVRTAENMLIAYERVMRRDSNRVELIAYAHGDEGRIQFQKNRRRYESRRVSL